MLEALLFYFAPLWVVCSYYLVKAYNFKFLRFIYGYLIRGVALFLLVFPVLFLLNLLPLEFMVLGEFNMWVWVFLFIIATVVLKKKGHGAEYSILLGMMIMFLATETWEIPTHVLTISMTPTIEQFLKTVMLSSPYLILYVPLFYEANKVGHKWGIVFEVWIFLLLPMIFGLVYVLNIPQIHDETGYIVDWFDYIIRITCAGIYLIFVSGFPKVNK